MDAKHFGNAGSKLFRLHQHRNQIAHTLYAGAFCHVFPCIGAASAGMLFQHHDVQFVAQLRLRLV